MKKIFTLDEDAVETLKEAKFNLVVKPKGKPEYSLGVGTQFAVVQRDGLEVRATMIDQDTGKPKRGRPRRFPTALVNRLLGEDFDTDDDDGDLSEDSEASLNERLVEAVERAAVADALQVAESTLTPEEADKLASLVEDDSTVDSW